MKILRNSLAIISLLAFTAWYALRRPASPSDELAPVSYTAFVSHAPNASAGLALAAAAREWNGVTAATFNEQSGLLVLAHTKHASAHDLLSRLSALTAAKPEIKVFETPSGPSCPVPMELIEKTPGIMLGLFSVSASIWLMLFLTGSSRPVLK